MDHPDEKKGCQVEDPAPINILITNYGRLLGVAARLGAVVSTGFLGCGGSSGATSTVGGGGLGAGGGSAATGVSSGFDRGKVTTAGQSQASKYDEGECEFTHDEVLSG